MPEVLGARRMLEVREITVEDVGEVEEVEELLLAISLHRGVTRLNLAGTDLTTVEPKLLTRAVAKMDRLKVQAARLTTQQIEAILVALGQAWNLAQALNGQDFLVYPPTPPQKYNNTKITETRRYSPRAYF